MITLNLQNNPNNDVPPINPQVGRINGMEIINIIEDPNVLPNDKFRILGGVLTFMGREMFGQRRQINLQEREITSLQASVNNLRRQNNELLSERNKNEFFETLELKEVVAPSILFGTLVLGLGILVPPSLIATGPAVGLMTFSNNSWVKEQHERFEKLKEKYKLDHPGCLETNAENFALGTLQTEENEREEREAEKRREDANREIDYDWSPDYDSY
ncbi:MAG: hypothetical protein H0V82_06230 [Candidatus Protochlamydia sp.]|nr:hypothetical protein [Candidatus Protochlamydia sp.]